MTENQTLFFNSATLFVSLVGIVYAGFQVWLIRKQITNAIDEIRLSAKVHSDNHEWNRRIASQDAIIQFRMKNKNKELRQSLDQVDINDVIPLKVIQEKFKTNPDLKDYIHETLNTFEGYSRGIIHGIYDEMVIKSAVKGAMIRHYNCFLPYIKHVRNSRNPDLYRDLETIVDKWKSEESKVPYRTKTGEK